MSGTKSGGENVRETMIKKHGSYEAYKAHMASIGSKGGSNNHTGGFAYLKRTGQSDLLSHYGSIGGRISKRGKTKKDDN